MGDVCADLLVGLLDEDATARTRSGLQAAVTSHERHRTGRFGEAVGALAVDVADLDALAALTADGDRGSLGITLGVHGHTRLAEALDVAEAVPSLRIDRVAVDVPAGEDAMAVADAVRRQLGGRPVPYAIRLDAELSTGFAGDQPGLASDLTTLVAAGVPVEVGGVECAVADSGGGPWGERTGVLNVLLAADAIRDGADVDEVRQILAVSDGLIEAVLLLDGTVRQVLPAISTTHLDDVVDDLAGLGLLSAAGGGSATG